MEQAKSMIKPVRMWTTIVFFVAMICTIVFALTLPIVPLILTCVVVQMCAYIWYSLSYIPFAQRMCKRFCGNLCEI